MQFGDDAQVGDEGAQLGRGAHVELGAPVDVEGLVQVVRLYPQQCAAIGELVEGEAVDRLLEVVARREQVGPIEAGRLDQDGVVQAA